MTDYRIRLSRPIISHLEGSSAWQEPRAELADGTLYSDPESVALMAKIRTASTRPDGSVTVALDDAERAVLREYVEVQVGVPRQCGGVSHRRSRIRRVPG
jgi:hypothetical protein